MDVKCANWKLKIFHIKSREISITAAAILSLSTCWREGAGGEGDGLLDFRSLYLILAMRRSGRCLVPDSCRFTLSVIEGCLAAPAPPPPPAAGKGGPRWGGCLYAGWHTRLLENNYVSLLKYHYYLSWLELGGRGVRGDKNIIVLWTAFISTVQNSQLYGWKNPFYRLEQW